MYKIEFDSEDSSIYWGETFYFHHKENIKPFIITELYRCRDIVEKDQGVPLEDYIANLEANPTARPWYIYELITED